ncbi:pelargonidin 3-o-(6-caffeoylglucoside) 5-o-(6-o-malonylglucoside) 4'''-malonyltransferase [Phtheirospermum japonicum]|uniref:Pelargonidin 3-o-(6-caffeoylglucoside) 5-o-(6-o-malonylglucoside) 4'''-malonyltransferase n=1 Tax=Phtheirospermum japonicum TaxID=374723 RepID=A0A830BKN6_9LAMI|nr:pelargonidin 3-o-(6-caffeoylglucoside) 5-o-(6-o-malonylglucoside) 4'''-malonyltransferase [Phtheirospermum japonicum]
MKANVISTKLIKPCTPTPQNLSKYKISLTEELVPPMNFSVILFYPANPNPKPTILTQLQESLSKILPQFYPFAGRYIKKDHSINCNDEGAEFVEAEATTIEMNDFISKTKNDQLNILLSRQTLDADKPTDPLLSVQITHFKCGGVSISISLSHRISDASSLGTFIAAWSNANNNNNNNKPIIPSFDSPSVFPGINLEYDIEPPPNNTVIKRLLFNKEAISSLRSKLRPNEFISRAMIGVEIAKKGKSRDCVICQAVNIRERTIPPLPKHSCGYLVIQSFSECNMAADIGFEELVNTLGDAINKTVNSCAELMSLGQDERVKFVLDPVMNFMKRPERGETKIMWFTDWSKFGFYEADFGWGNKPVWVGIGSVPSENLGLFMNNKEGDGIEAWVFLNQNDVPYFEKDEYMKLFITA